MQNRKLPYVPLGLNEQRPVKMYDVDMKTLIREFESISACARHICVNSSDVSNCLKHKIVMKKSTNSLGLRLAFR